MKQVSKRYLITGGAGFIGSAVCRHLIENTAHHVVNFDKLTYAANLSSLAPIEGSNRYTFVQGDICDRDQVRRTLEEHQVDVVMNLAAESHVDRSISGPSVFLETNVMGTFGILSAAADWYESLSPNKKNDFRFLHVSTDEVFGDLPMDDSLFSEDTPYAPSSPYSASKAASDHLVHAWERTYGLPVLLSNCSNNYGPYHFPEKLIPLTILNVLHDKPISVYGDGSNVRDWLYVDDHARALTLITEEAEIGSRYNVGGNNEATNLTIVHTICDTLDKLRPRSKGTYRELITFVADRPGHDQRYAIDASKIEHELGWKPVETLESGLARTIQWYLDNEAWWRPIREKSYAGERLGLKGAAA